MDSYVYMPFWCFVIFLLVAGHALGFTIAETIKDAKRRKEKMKFITLTETEVKELKKVCNETLEDLPKEEKEARKLYEGILEKLGGK